MSFIRPSSTYAPTDPLITEEFLVRHFYHVTDLPDGRTTSGMWDLRGGAAGDGVDAYLGNVDLGAKRVLEIGPASGFLTVEMEKRGADVTAIEIPDEDNWDFVPYPAHVMAGVRAERLKTARVMKEAFRFTKCAFNLKADVVYAHATRIPHELGMFDVAVLAAVLLHTRHPLDVLIECGKRANTIIVTEPLYQSIEGIGAVACLHPTVENKDWGTWWHFSTSYFTQFLGVLGYNKSNVTYHEQTDVSAGRRSKLFTVVASRTGSVHGYAAAEP
jgi:hypothetical protein